MMLTIIKTQTPNFELGKIFINPREALNIGDSRADFINDRDEILFNYEYTDSYGNGSWISEKTLMNYELGKNIPTLKMLKRLAAAYEVDTIDLIKEVLPFID